MTRLATLVLLLMATGARADEPLPLASDHVVRSPNGRCTARAVAATSRVEVSGLAPDGHVVSWHVQGWHRDLQVGNDCSVVGVGYDGLNLLAAGDRAAGTPVMTFFHQDGPGRVVRLGDLYPDLSVLPRTASHWQWRRETGWDGQHWTARTVDGRTARFDSRG